MLDILRRIVQDVNQAQDLAEALGLIVTLVKGAMNADVCSVYLLDSKADRYLLRATDGLDQEAVGKASVQRSKGLVGLVGLREEPINLKDAHAHPDYSFIKDIGEEKYYAFLGVPIIHHRQLLGVLVVQRSAPKRFDELEESFLVTISAQLSGVIAHAEATGNLAKTTRTKKPRLARFSGVPGSPGVGMGEGVVVLPAADLSAVPEQTCGDVEIELKMLTGALDAVRGDVEKTAERLSKLIQPQERALFDVYLHILSDSSLGNEIISRIKNGHAAQWALKQVVDLHVRKFEMMDDAYLRERAIDVKDLGRRILGYLQQQDPQDIDYPEAAILVSEELTPAMLGEVPNERLVGLVSVKGSGNSHVAILARAMGIPTVMGALDLPYNKLAGRELIVDGNTGRVYTNPTARLRSYYQEILRAEEELDKNLLEIKDKLCITLDNYRVPLWVNTGLISEIIPSLKRGAEGVGLYRTEIPFMMQDRFPSEREQAKIYREQLEAFAPLPVTMRTLDIGGDKTLSYFPIEEDNPFLGWRGIRVTLDHPEIFLVQIRAMLKASVGLNNLRIILPVITNTEEFDDAYKLIQRAYTEIVAEGNQLSMPPVGIMIEVPAAVHLAHEFCRRADFLSVGSNDLTQYILAVDRNNPRVAKLYDSFHPAVLRALQWVVSAAHDEGKQISICGEMAGNPAAAVLLTAMGFDALSMNANNLPKVKWILRNISLGQARKILTQILRKESSKDILVQLEKSLTEEGLGQVLNPHVLN